jgi:hypothetical protein
VTRDQIKRISTLMASLAAELEVVVQEPPPKQLSLSTSLLDHAPRRLADLPGWFAALPRHQFDAVWCIAIIDAVTCEPYSVRDLAAALHAVRDYPRVDVAPLDAPRSVAIPEPAGDHRRVLNPTSPAPAAPATSPEPARNQQRATPKETPRHAEDDPAKDPPPTEAVSETASAPALQPTVVQVSMVEVKCVPFVPADDRDAIIAAADAALDPGGPPKPPRALFGDADLAQRRRAVLLETRRYRVSEPSRGRLPMIWRLA